MVRHSDLKTAFRQLFKDNVLIAQVLYPLEISGVTTLLNSFMVIC